MQGDRVARTATTLACAALVLGGCTPRAADADPGELTAAFGAKRFGLEPEPEPVAATLFEPCGTASADPSRTNLRASALTPEDRAIVGDSRWIPEGALVVTEAAQLDLPDGMLGSGNGYEIAVGQPYQMVPLADGPITAAPISVATIVDGDSPTGWIAFVEIRLSPEPPITWTQEQRLVISTDGGDGGFIAGGATFGSWDDYFAASFPDKDDTSTWRNCLLRSAGGHVNGILIGTGGDGGFPTYLGKNATGEVVSVVLDVMTLPWSLSGLPGEHPPVEEVGP